MACELHLGEAVTRTHIHVVMRTMTQAQRKQHGTRNLIIRPSWVVESCLAWQPLKTLFSLCACRLGMCSFTQPAWLDVFTLAARRGTPESPGGGGTQS